MRRLKGISLTEVIVVVAILAVIAAIVFPLQANAKLDGLKISCLTRQRQIYQALLLYGDDNPGYEKVHPNVDMPAEPMRNPLHALLPYLKSREMLYCPATPQCGKNVWGSTYVFSVGPRSGAPLASVSGAQHFPKFDGDGANHHPLIYSLIFDEIYYHPSERHLSDASNPPYLTYITANGAAKKGRFPVLRARFLEFACGGKY